MTKITRVKCSFPNSLQPGIAFEVYILYVQAHESATGTYYCKANAEQGSVHCDMKPENILLVPGSTTKVRVIDFGSACKVGQKHFDYIQSRFYRAPEVILGMKYGPPIDMWSLACIVAEFIGGKPLFAGATEQQQLLLQMTILGIPPKSILARAPRKSTFFDESNNPKMIGGKRRKPGCQTLDKANHCTDPELLDFLSQCLTWDPEQRLTV